MYDGCRTNSTLSKKLGKKDTELIDRQRANNDVLRDRTTHIGYTQLISVMINNENTIVINNKILEKILMSRCLFIPRTFVLHANSYVFYFH